MTRQGRLDVEQAPGKTNKMTVQSQETDTPLLPVEQMARLYQFRPDVIDWILDQTTKEADNRRKEEHRLHSFVFIERFGGQIFGFFIGIAGVAGGAWTAVRGYSGAGATIASIAIGTLAIAFLGRRSGEGK